MRSFLLVAFLGAALLLGCNCSDYGLARCGGADCICTGSDCLCTDTGCECGGPDCVCTGSGCNSEGNAALPSVDEPLPGEKISWDELIAEGNVETAGVIRGDDGAYRPLKTGENLNYMWLANTAEGYVSKYDTNTGREVARYLTLFPLRCGDGELGRNCTIPNGLVSGNGPKGLMLQGWEIGIRGLQPSRTAVDYRGNAWVGNRAILLNQKPADQDPLDHLPEQGEKHASVTKIAHASTPQEASERCRNGGRRTSRDINGNGVIDDNEWYHPRSPGWDWTDPNTYDDCVLFTTPACTQINTPDVADAPRENAGVRALAVSSSGDAWAGCWSDKTLIHLEGNSGRVLNTVSLDIRPYGAIADRADRVWVVQKESEMVSYTDEEEFALRPDRITQDFALQAVDARAIDANGKLLPGALLPKVSPEIDTEAYNQCSAYGLGLDQHGRIWMSARFTEGIAVCRYDPQAQADNAWQYWGINPVYWGKMHGDTRDPGPPQETNVPGVLFGLARGIAVDSKDLVYMSGNGGNKKDIAQDQWQKTRSQLMVLDSAKLDAGDGILDAIIPVKVDGTEYRAYDATGEPGAVNAETGAIGVGIDTEGRAWMVNHTGTAIRFSYDGRLVVPDLNTRDVPIAVNGVPPPPPKEGLYTYSDFTGYQLRAYVPEGYVRFYLKACNGDPATRPIWYGMTWEGNTPPPTDIRIEVRYGTETEVKNNRGILKTYQDSAPGTDGMRTINLEGGEPVFWMSVTFYLDSKGGPALPSLRDFAVYTYCPGDLG